MQTEQDLEKLVRAYTAPLLRYCTALLGSEADAQDAVQTTFVKAWLRRHTLRGGGQDNERAWLYRIAYRTALDMLRAAKRSENRRPPEPVPPDPGIREELRDALNALDPLDRALVLERVLAAIEAAHGPLPTLRLPAVKFQRPLLPGDEARIHLEQPAPGRWRFRVICGEAQVASGDVVAGAG